MDPIFEFVFLGVTLFTIGLLLLRVRQLEKRRREAKTVAAIEPASETTPDTPASTFAADGETDTWAMLVSPLTVILAQCELARGLRKMDERLHVIERQALRMRELLERHPNAQKQILNEIEDVNPHEIIQAAVDSYDGLALDRDVGMHLMLEDTPLARTNVRLLNRALRHLIRTAITSAPAGRGDVTVAIGLLPAEGEPTHVGFAVADDGPGIETARLVRILDPSIEEDVPASAEELAYSVVYALARAMGASFAMDSAPGTGTRATLKVPLKPVGAPTIPHKPVAAGAAS